LFVLASLDGRKGKKIVLTCSGHKKDWAISSQHLLRAPGVKVFAR
jgi:hypothetical protein